MGGTLFFPRSPSGSSFSLGGGGENLSSGEKYRYPILGQNSGTCTKSVFEDNFFYFNLAKTPLFCGDQKGRTKLCRKNGAKFFFKKMITCGVFKIYNIWLGRRIFRTFHRLPTVTHGFQKSDFSPPSLCPPPPPPPSSFAQLCKGPFPLLLSANQATKCRLAAKHLLRFTAYTLPYLVFFFAFAT